MIDMWEIVGRVAAEKGSSPPSFTRHIITHSRSPAATP